MSRAYEVRQRLRPAMLALRAAEDWARLTLNDDVLASRIREIHESLTEDVIEGRTTFRSTANRARLWDRYAVWRGHDPHEGGHRVTQAIRRWRAETSRP